MSTPLDKPTFAGDAQDRRVCAYPSPYYKRLIAGYAKYTEMSESSTAAGIIKQFFDSMPQPERERILNFSKNNY